MYLRVIKRVIYSILMKIKDMERDKKSNKEMFTKELKMKGQAGGGNGG